MVSQALVAPGGFNEGPSVEEVDQNTLRMPALSNVLEL